MAEEKQDQNVAIVGGGITGLYSALQALDRGETDIHVYEASDRLGGKVQSGSVAGQTVNLGAEFLDSDDTRLLALCERLGVPVEATQEQGEEMFQTPDGTLVSSAQFHAAYGPIAKQVIAHRQAIERDPNGALAQRLKSMSLDAYLNELGRTTPANSSPSFWQRLWSLFSFQGNRVNPAMLGIAANAFSHELGRTPDAITAAQFIFESSPTTDRLLASDCAYRVKGGTENMVHALRNYLQQRGVKFHTGQALQSVALNADSTKALTFASATGSQTVRSGKLMLALPAYALGKVEGLSSLGLDERHQQVLKDVQYTNNAKFTVALKPGVKLPDVNFFSKHGECWSPAPGLLTFLCHNPGNVAPQVMMQQALGNYAAALGTSADALFDTTRGNVVFVNPGRNACWSTPSPRNAIQAEQMFKRMEGLADKGVAIAGTYMPHEGTVGFMECGLAASEKACARVFCNRLESSQAISQTPAISFVERETARRAALAQQQTVRI